MALYDVLKDVETSSPAKKKGDGPPKRYIPFLLDEWHATIDKAFGRAMDASDIKKVLLLICSGELVLTTKKRYETLETIEAMAKDAKLI